jgi:hypothetical protein
LCIRPPPPPSSGPLCPETRALGDRKRGLGHCWSVPDSHALAEFPTIMIHLTMTLLCHTQIDHPSLQRKRPCKRIGARVQYLVWQQWWCGGGGGFGPRERRNGGGGEMGGEPYVQVKRFTSSSSQKNKRTIVSFHMELFHIKRGF